MICAKPNNDHAVNATAHVLVSRDQFGVEAIAERMLHCLWDERQFRGTKRD